MTALSDQCTVIRAWLNRDAEDYPDALVTSWIRMAESRISRTLRCADQIDVDYAEVTIDRVLFPMDWLDLDFVRVIDGEPLEFLDRTTFYRKPLVSQIRYYTITGNWLVVGGPPTEEATREIEMSYYASVPPLEASNTWLQTKYPDLFLMATMVAASAYGVEDERATGFDASVKAAIQEINDQHSMAKASGSRLRRRTTRGYT